MAPSHSSHGCTFRSSDRCPKCGALLFENLEDDRICLGCNYRRPRPALGSATIAVGGDAPYPAIAIRLADLTAGLNVGRIWSYELLPWASTWAYLIEANYSCYRRIGPTILSDCTHVISIGDRRLATEARQLGVPLKYVKLTRE